MYINFVCLCFKLLERESEQEARERGVVCDVRGGSGRETEAFLWFYMYTVGKEEKQDLFFPTSTSTALRL